MRLSRARGWLIIGCCVFIAVFNWTYIHIISDPFAYLGYVYDPPAFPYIALAFFLAVLPATWLPTAMSRPSQVIYWILYLLVIVPGVLVPLYTLRLEPRTILTFGCYLSGAFFLLGRIYSIPLARVRRLSIPGVVYWPSLAAFGLVLYFIIGQHFGLGVNIQSVIDVYDVREDFKGVIGQAPLVSYSVNWLGNVINPLLIARGMITRNALAVVSGIVGQLVLFTITGFKSVFFSALLVAALLWAIRRGGRSFGIRILFGLSGLMALSPLVDNLIDRDFFVFIFIRRLLATPGLVTGYYFEYFSRHEFALLAHSINVFADYPYALDPPALIALRYFGSSSISANGNLWADAFANFGVPGIFLFTALLGTILWLFDSITRMMDMRIAALLLGIPAFTLANSALLTSLLNHGIGLAIVAIYLIPPITDRRLISGDSAAMLPDRSFTPPRESPPLPT